VEPNRETFSRGDEGFSPGSLLYEAQGSRKLGVSGEVSRETTLPMAVAT
jgi:hypothetical protein